MNKEEQEIIESTKEFAKAHNIHYDQMTENMILNAMREQLLLHVVSNTEGKLLCEDCNKADRYLMFRVCEPCLIKGKYIAK
jgi:hypothetical protein|tara:strand:+ start:99 stop:341 length:243 start_codon:yes stop_codon:yes gene_type:complete